MNSWQQQIERIVSQLERANLAYRTGSPILSDSEYDDLVEELRFLDPDNSFFGKVGNTTKDVSRKSLIPIPMASMNKIKNMEDFYDHLRLKNIDPETEFVLTPKYDGISQCADENVGNAWTRGDGEEGQTTDEHFSQMGNQPNNNTECPFTYTYGEVMMPIRTFEEKYSDTYANPRNMTGGLINSKKVTDPVSDLVYVRYGAYFKTDTPDTKSGILDRLNSYQSIKVPYHLTKGKDLTHEKLTELFKEWSTEFEIDGIIVEVNSLSHQDMLGRDMSTGNPLWAVAYKSPDFEESAETTVTGITWNISKQGLLKPVVQIEPVRLNGVTINNVTGNNARFIKEMGIGIGAKVVIKRSGMVIPLITQVTHKVEFTLPDLPNIGWNDNGVELITLTETDEQRLQQAISFLDIIGVEEVGEGVVRQLWDAGYNSIGSILMMTPEEMENLEGFGKRKAEIVYRAIQSKLKNIPLSILQHATGMFKGLGSKKLALLEHFTYRPSFEEIIELEGFAETSANSYLEGYDRFFEFISTLPVTYTVPKVVTGGELEGKIFVFTGIRRKDLENTIVEMGGKIGSSVSGKTTHLVMKAKGSGSSKEKKALELGVEIMTVGELENFLNK
jgi:DNA ligase (NAD+)